MLGNPKYKLGETVQFWWNDDEKKEGIIYFIDKYGTFEYPDDVSYDIMVYLNGDQCLFKHITEKEVIGIVKTYEIWAEGYCTTGDGLCKAQLIGEQKATSFQEACDIFFADEKHKGYYNSLKRSYWGWRLYDNEDDARKNFG